MEFQLSVYLHLNALQHQQTVVLFFTKGLMIVVDWTHQSVPYLSFYLYLIPPAFIISYVLPSLVKKIKKVDCKRCKYLWK